ncbi:unnamed protein product [Polarella glacialis]|uniref:Mitotic checkpoint protein BUB3 n=1 Tax=Polarella glacialis TaxID=89957 RepID=A0A813GDE4_POLGL|nr:unnamed protein product [Polarella glacialis]
MTMKLQQPPLDCISRVRFAPFAGSTQLLASSWDSHVRLYDASSGKLTGVQKHPLAVLDCTFLQDSSRCVSGGLARKLVVFDFRSQQELLLGEHDEAIRCVEFHSHSQQVFSASWDRTLRAWDLRQPGPSLAVVNLGTKAFCMDVGVDKVIVGGADRCVHVFDTRRLGTLLEKRESSLKHQIRSVKVGIDQKFFASSSVEGRVAIEYFDPEENLSSRYAFKCHRVREAGCEEKVHPVNAIDFHPVHGTFATGGSDGGVCVWDGYAKKRVWKLNPFHTSVSSLSFSADGSQLAVAVSYTFDDGERMPPPVPELVVRQVTSSEVMAKVSKDA